MATIKNFNGKTVNLYHVTVHYKTVWNSEDIGNDYFYEDYQFVGYKGLKDTLEIIQELKNDRNTSKCTKTYITNVSVRNTSIQGFYSNY